MVEQHDQRPAQDIVLEVSPGIPEEAERNLAISPACLDELRSCLDAEGLEWDEIHARSVDTWLGVVAVSVASGGVLTQLTIALQKFLERHKNTDLKFGPHGRLQSMTGYSRKDVERVLEITNRMQLERDQHFTEIMGDDQPEADPGAETHTS